MPTVIHDDIYKEVRSYLIGLFSCEPETVIKGYQNGAPLPENAVVMTILYERNLDVSVNYYDTLQGITTVQQSVEVTMQVDFYGDKGATRCRKLSSLWKNMYTTQVLKCCQPLYSKASHQLQYINEKDQYEQRWSVDILLQYNPEFEHDQEYLGAPYISISQP